MKNFFLSLGVATILATNVHAQNIFPASGNVGIGTLSPAASLQVLGASRFGSTSNYTGIDASGNLSFAGTSAYRVANNQFAFRLTSNLKGGLYYNATNSRYEFRSTTGTAIFNIASTTGLVGVRGAINTTYALNVNASSVYNGINVTDPVNNYAFYSVKTGNNPALYVENSNATSTGSVLKAVSRSNTRAIEGISNEAGTGVYGSAINGAGVYGYDGASGDGVTGYSNNGYGVTGSTSEGLAGVYGYDNDQSIAVYGRSVYGVGVFGYSSGNSATGGYAGKFTSINYRGIYVSGASGFFAGYFSGDVYTTGLYQSSDAKLKKNIKEFANAMTLIRSLQPKNYEFRNDGNYAKMNLPQGTHYGLLAQDIEKILPGLVKNNQFDTRDAADPNSKKNVNNNSDQNETIDFKSVNYTELIPIMIKALQEQDKTIESLQEKVEGLVQTIKKLSGNTAVSSATQNTNAVASAALTNTLLEQNSPNPFNVNTRINYTLPVKYTSAQIIIADNNGKVIKELYLTGAGKGSVNIDNQSLASGIYNYTLLIDGKLTGSRQMVVAK